MHIFFKKKIFLNVYLTTCHDPRVGILIFEVNFQDVMTWKFVDHSWRKIKNIAWNFERWNGLKVGPHISKFEGLLSITYKCMTFYNFYLFYYLCIIIALSALSVNKYFYYHDYYSLNIMIVW